MTLTDKALRINENVIEEHEAMLAFFTEIEPDEDKAYFASKALTEARKQRHRLLMRRVTLSNRETLQDCLA